MNKYVLLVSFTVLEFEDLFYWCNKQKITSSFAGGSRAIGLSNPGSTPVGRISPPHGANSNRGRNGFLTGGSSSLNSYSPLYVSYL